MTVFVSYSSRDRDAVKSLTQDLQDADEQVWMDQRLAGGEAWWRAILEQIRGCDVFIFALSQNSIDSKPCQAELQYAQALGLPILPVQVGLVDSMSLNPLATVQAIDYRHQTPNTGMRLIAALNRERARRQPLPEPLPEEPPVPFEYLIRLYTTISNPDYLTPRDQAALVAQLQVGLGEDGQHEAARNDIVMILTKLHDREDATHRTRTDVEAILASTGAETRLQAPIATETITPVEEQVGATTPPVSTVPPAQTEPEPADKNRTTLDRPTGMDSRTESDDHRVLVTAPPADELTASPTSAKSSDTSIASAIKTTPAPSVKQPMLQRLSRRTKIAVIAGAVAVIATVVLLVVFLSARPTSQTAGPTSQTAGPTSQTAGPTSQTAGSAQTVLPFTGLDHPTGVAVDSAGAVYVSDSGNGRVLKLAAGASTPTVLPCPGARVAVDSAGNVYVTNVSRGVLKLAAGSSTQTVLPFTGLDHPEGVAVDSAGNVYVTDVGNNRVLKLAPGASTPTELPFTDLDWPSGVAVDSAGAVYVSDDHNNRVLELAAGASTPTVLPFTGLNSPRDVAVDGAGNVYVADFLRGVLKLAAGTSTPTVLPFTGLSNGLGDPWGVAVDGAGNVYVADQNNNRVLKLPAQ